MPIMTWFAPTCTLRMLRLRRPDFISVEPLRFLVLSHGCSVLSIQFFFTNRSFVKLTAMTAAFWGMVDMARLMLSQMRTRSLKSVLMFKRCLNVV